MNQPKISVIIPVYNSAAYLEKCLESVIHQTYRNLEIILINDGSTDASPEICRQYAALDDRVVYLSQENKGVSASRNRGLVEAKGDWLSFVDSDDYLELNAYSHCVELIARYSCDAVCYEYFATYPCYETQHSLQPDRYGILDRKQAMHLLHNGLPFTVVWLFHRKLVEGVFFDIEIFRGEDTKFNAEVIHKADKIYFSNKPLYHYVQSEESACRGRFRPTQLTAVRLEEFYLDFFSKHYPDLLAPWYVQFLHLLIMLYYDMYIDDLPYYEERRMIFEKFKQIFHTADLTNVSIKNKVKFYLFRYFTKLFCVYHRVSTL